MRRKRQIEASDVDVGGLEAGWPPEWMTSYADVATLLMTFFIILSTLLVLKIDIRFLRGVNVFTQVEGDVIEKSSLVKYTVEQKQLIEKFKNLEEQQTREEVSVSQVKQMGKDIQQYILDAELDAFVRVDTTKWKVKVTPIAPFLFPPARATLRPEAEDFLERLAKFFRINPGQLRIAGHTDNFPIYTPVYRSNWELSCARAAAVMRYLVDERGIEPARITAVGYGPYHPIGANNTPEGRRKNRRVEIEIIQKPDQELLGEESEEGPPPDWNPEM